MLGFIEYLNLPTKIAIVFVSIFFFMQFIGEILEFKGKVVPEFMKIRKYFRRKKAERQRSTELIEQVQVLLNEVNQHYSADNITKRNEWMAWVNARAKVYDASVAELTDMKEALAANNELTLDLYINVNRDRILDFARVVADDKALASREEFNRIYKVNKSYHDILFKYDKENGEVDTAMKLIDEAYDYRMKHRCFIEDIRGYSN